MAGNNDLRLKVRQLVYDETENDSDVFTLAIKKFLNLPDGEYKNFSKDYLTFSRTLKQVIWINLHYYKNGEWDYLEIDVTGMNPEEIHSYVAQLQENYYLEHRETYRYLKSINSLCKDKGCKIISHYFVTENEVLTDNREKFGHENQKSEKRINIVIGDVYTMGEEVAFEDLLSKRVAKTLSEREEKALNVFIDELYKGEGKSNEELKDIVTRVIKMEYGENKKLCFWKREEGSVIRPLKIK